MSEYTIDNPEDGCFWRLLGEEEIERYEQTDAAETYGLAQHEAVHSQCRVLAKCTILTADTRKILMGVSKKFVLQWRLAKQGQCALLRIPGSALTDADFEQLGHGVAVLGEAAVRLGELVPLE